MIWSLLVNNFPNRILHNCNLYIFYAFTDEKKQSRWGMECYHCTGTTTRPPFATFWQHSGRRWVSVDVLRTCSLYDCEHRVSLICYKQILYLLLVFFFASGTVKYINLNSYFVEIVYFKGISCFILQRVTS